MQVYKGPLCHLLFLGLLQTSAPALAEQPKAAQSEAKQSAASQKTEAEPDRFSDTPADAGPSAPTNDAETDKPNDPESDATPEEESASTVEATRLFDTGRTQMQEGNFAEACKSFERSLALVAGVGTEFNLANCYEKKGERVKAYQLFVGVAEATKQAGELERQRVAEGHAASLKASLGELTLRSATPATSQHVTVDEEPWLIDASSEPRLLEPGLHVVSARAPGRVGWSKQVTLRAGESHTLVVPELEPTQPKSAVPEEQQEPEQSERWSWVPPTALGIGAVGLFAGLAFTQQYRASHEDAKAVCPSSYGCTASEIELHDQLVEDSRRARNRAIIGYSVAALGLATGVAYYLVRPGAEGPPEEGDVALVPFVDQKAAGGFVHGTF